MQRKNNQNIKLQDSKMKTKKIGIIVSSYNNDITYPIRDKAIETLLTAGVVEKNIFIIEAPGAFEIPFLCQKYIKEKKLNGVISIGCVIKGDTDHYHFVAQEATRGIMDVMLATRTPISNAILTVNTLQQAIDRSSGSMNKGIEATNALIEVLKL